LSWTTPCLTPAASAWREGVRGAAMVLAIGF
jgi:hypothetical protein